MDMDYMMPNKIFYHPDRIKAYLNGKLVRPITVKVYLTDKCNLKCGYCVYKDRINAEEMAKEDVAPIFCSLMKMGVKGIVFTGGEPTCHSSLHEVAKFAKRNCGFDLGLITNGIIYPNALEYLTWIRFSVDTTDRATYEEMKGKDMLLDVDDNIHKAVAEKARKNLSVTIGVQMVVAKANYREIINFIKYWETSGIDYCQIRPIENYKYSKAEWGCIQKQLEEVRRAKYKIKVMTTQYKWEELKNNYRKSYLGCPGADFIGAVDTKGDFYICCTMLKDKTAKYGNLIWEDINAILYNRKKIQTNFDYSKCPVACQGTLMNKQLVAFKKLQHRNFV